MHYFQMCAFLSQKHPCKQKSKHTVDSLVKQQQELVNSVSHLRLCEVQQRNHFEVELPQEIGEVVHVHHGSFKLRVVLIRQIADQQGHFVSRCGRTQEKEKSRLLHRW